jgi:DNA-binding PadR family transcriptional regulator
MINHGTSRLSPEYVLLGFLYQNPNHGYELHKQMEGEFENIWHASQSQTYNILKRLATQGYIYSTPVEQEKLPPRQLLYINEVGKKRFEDWLDTPTKPSVHAIRVEFISRLYFMQLYFPQKVPQIIRTQIDVVTEGLVQQKESLQGLPEDKSFNRLALELRIKLLHSVIEWLKNCDAAFETRESIGDEHV